MDTRREKLETLKKEKNAVIMAHYYVPDEVQEIADYIGDSYYLSDMERQNLKPGQKSTAPGSACRLPDGSHGSD